MHVHVCARHLMITHIREVKSCAVAMTALCHGVDVSAALQELDILLRAQNRSDIELIVRQVITG